jgi:hypothetical protein
MKVVHLSGEDAAVVRRKMARDLYWHLRQGHDHTEEEALDVILRDLVR